MSDITINEALVLQRAIRERLNELKTLRSDVSKKESYLYSASEKRVIEPLYDVKAVDKKITDLEMFLLKSDSKIKTSNAVTKINIDFDTEKLLEPIS